MKSLRKNQNLSTQETSERKSISRINLLKQQLIDIRLRKQKIPHVPKPKIVDSFIELHQIKSRRLKKIALEKQIESKKKQYLLLKKSYESYKEKYELKEQMFKERPHLIKILSSKLQNEYEKTFQKYKEVQFNQIIINGIKKVSYYRLAQLLFNQNARNVFSVIDIKQSTLKSKSDDQVAICLGYLGLLIIIVAQIASARIWINFTFRGSKSTIKLNDGTIAVLHPRERRLSQATKVLSEQLYQIMKFTLGMNIDYSLTSNFYQLSEQLTKFLMS